MVAERPQAGLMVKHKDVQRNRRTPPQVEARGDDLVTVMLAVWAVGGVYIPIERSDPGSRVGSMLAAAAPALVVSQAEPNTASADLLGSLPMVGLDALTSLDTDKADGAVDLVPYRYQTLRDPAYVVFTSGSTGPPKAVEIHIGGLLNHLNAKIEAGRLGPDDVFAQLAPMSFDVHIWQLMASLVTGGTLRIFPHEELRDPIEFARLARRDGVTALQAVPSYLESWSHIARSAYPADGPSASLAEDYGIPGLRTLYCTGEAFPAALTPPVRALFPSAMLVNAYGPAEGSDNVAHHTIGAGPADDTVVPIGKPIANARLYVLDRWHRLRPPGLRGELAIGGLSVGNGYIAPSSRTVFLPDPWLPGTNMYLTGDQGSLQNGLFYYHGRNDTQIKLAGRRVEIGEIENACMSLPFVSSAAVSIMRIAASQVLVGFVVCPTGDAAVIRTQLRELLPGYMIPDRLLIVDQLPLNANGKVDRRALREWAEASIVPGGQDEVSESAAEGFADRLESEVWEAWGSVLGPSRLVSTANFFGIGGDSLKAIRMVAHLRAAGVRADVEQLYEAQTLGEFTAVVKRGDQAGRPMPPPPDRQ